MTGFIQPITPDNVAALIDLSVKGEPDTDSMAQLQCEGVAALYNILCKGDVAYLADEVGMGKTYQAMGLASVLWNDNPKARVLFISPRENLQVKWVDDYRRFFADNYRRAQGQGDDHTSSVLFGDPVHRPVKFDNLRSWVPTVGRPEPMAAFLRHTSFTRPVFLVPGDAPDLDAIWHEQNAKFKRWGLFDVKRPRGLSTDIVSMALNLSFADAVNRRLRAVSDVASPYFDLVVLDEAQCLRNPDNQTNQVLYRILDGMVGKWLFMSATPAHSGPGDIPTVVNHYPAGDDLVDPSTVEDLPALQRQMQPFMVRRQRKYRTGADMSSTYVGKTEYRQHDLDSWAVGDTQMSPLSTLAIGVIQKGLVEVLHGQNNRYRIGFLSSFESLQQSVGSRTDDRPSEEPSEDDSDWHHDSGGSSRDSNAPDTELVNSLARDFETQFGLPLPHPKVKAVTDKVARAAFGTDSEPGGEKHLIFTRRVSTVETLRDRLQQEYLRTVERRVKRYWGETLDWSGTEPDDVTEEEDDDPERIPDDLSGDLLRHAMGEKAWLGRYRKTFRTTGRNAMVFEDGWLSRLCTAGGVKPKQAATALPQELWAESWTHASRASGARQSQHRARRLRYLAVQGIRRAPQAFGLTDNSARPWRVAYESALHEHLERARADPNPHVDTGLFTAPTLWTEWDRVFPDDEMALPAALPNEIEPLEEALYRRQVARTVLGQVFRLTDTLVDLYFADQRGQQTNLNLPGSFLRWVASDDAGAQRLRRDCTQWLAHLRLIIDSSLDGAGRSWAQLARQESWPQLFNISAVMGVTGGSGAHRTATRQFRTPSLPRVIVCTDTLKEGVDLHLFCDRVIHYGVAWTPGDLEQRVGRVDRYFSQVERRLRDDGGPPDVHLEVGYPHVVSSMERGQVTRVRQRQRRAEALMDSPLGGLNGETRELTVSDLTPPPVATRLGPFPAPTFSSTGRRIARLDPSQAKQVADHYKHWYDGFVDAVENEGWNLTPASRDPQKQATIEGRGRTHEVEWSFDAPLDRYIVTVTVPAWPLENGFSGGSRRRLRERRWVEEGFIRVLVPKRDEPYDGGLSKHVVATLAGQVPTVQADATGRWHDALPNIIGAQVTWLSDHKAGVTVPRGGRSHTVTLYVYQYGFRAIGIIAPPEELTDRGPWTGIPSADDLRRWTLEETNELGLGFLAAHHRDGLVFGMHVLHGDLSLDSTARLIEEVAWRSDAWEATLTGQDLR